MEKHNNYKQSIACYRSGYFDPNGFELVIVPSYDNNGNYGYFVVYEDHDKVDHLYHYGNEEAFIEKVYEDSYQEALDTLQEVIDDTPTLKTTI